MSTTCFLIAFIAFASNGLADTFESNLFYDNADGQNVGGNITVLEFDYVVSLTSAEGIVFDATFRLMGEKDGVAANLRTNGGSGDREFGVRGTDGADNGAIEPGESITASLIDLTITDFAGNDPADVTVVFDGFTNVILYFTGNDGDSGEVTDGSGTLIFEFNGSLDPLENGGMPDVNDPSLFVFGVSGEGTDGSGVQNARIDVSGVTPETLVVNGTVYSGDGSPTELNRFRVDDLGVQFTVTVKGGFLIGDVNCDGSIDLLDVGPFVSAITSGKFNPKADINQDGFVDLLDVGPFVDLLSGN